MKPKEKAEELVRQNLIIISNLENLYGNNIEFEELKLDKNFEKAIECTKKAVDEIINERENFLLFYPKMTTNKLYFWQEVKNELNKML